MNLGINAYNPGNSFTFNSSYQMRFHPVDKVLKLHAGADFSASAGTKIPAAASGTVFFVDSIGGYGNTVVLKHIVDGQTFYTLYGHLQSLPSLTVGQVIEAGQSVDLLEPQGNQLGHISILK